jgi:hypothetical protein
LNITSVPYIFARPAGGWSGNIHQSGSLVATGAQLGYFAISGRTVFTTGVLSACDCDADAVYVFSEPARAWSGTVYQTAELLGPPHSRGMDPLGASPDNVGTSSSWCVTSTDCGGSTSVFTEPAKGWSGTLFERSAAGAGSSCLGALSGSPCALAFDGNTMFETEPTSGSVAMYAINGTGQIVAPSATRISLTGLTSGSPRLKIRMSAASKAPRIKSFEIDLPPGLHFTNARRRISGGLRILGERRFTFTATRRD